MKRGCLYQAPNQKVIGMRQKMAGKYISVITKEPQDGIDLTTTIDIFMQDIVETALAKELKRINAISGTVVLMKVKTGEVLAISNLAAADSGVYTETKNFAVSDQSEPGSTFKTFSMIVALEDGVVNPGDSVDTGCGRKPMYGRVMTDHNWNHGGYHTITAAQSIWYSSNIGVSSIIDKNYKNNPSKFVDGLYRMGLNKPMNLEIPGAGRPMIPHPKHKRYWARTDLPWMSIGYVTQMPPIYTLAFYNAIANNGVLLRPYFVKSLSRNGEVVKEFEPKVLNNAICSQRTLHEIKLMLDSVIVHGTGKPINSPVVRIAGKTGTAQLSKGVQGYKQGIISHQVSFCGYFPAENPEYSCIVVVREPRSELPSGGKQAGGVFREIAERIYARDYRLIPGVRRDSLAGPIPMVKAGNTELTTLLLSRLNVPYRLKTDNEPQWIMSSTTDRWVELTRNETRLKLVPDVRNMGARDAVYLLGKMGLRVTITGKGKVIKQSVSPGSLYNVGQTVSLTLD